MTSGGVHSQAGCLSHHRKKGFVSLVWNGFTHVLKNRLPFVSFFYFFCFFKRYISGAGLVITCLLVVQEGASQLLLEKIGI